MSKENNVGVYSIYNDNTTPDKIIKYKGKLHNKEKVVHKLPIFKKNKKDIDVIGYLTNEHSSEIIADKNNMMLTDPLCYSELLNEKKKFHRVLGYVRVNEFQYVGVTKSIILILIWFLLGLCIGLLLLSKLPAGESIINIGGNKEDITINESVINLDEIPEDTEQIDLTQDMAYISGQSITTVKASYPNVYLKNDKENDKYTLVYEVYINGSDKCAYKSGNIPPGAAEPWNAYECAEIKNGKNSIVYEVYVYDSEGFNVAQTTLTGLTIIKQ